jgi:hypothetical protein
MNMRIRLITLAILFLVVWISSCQTKNLIKPEDDYKLISLKVERFQSLYNEQKSEQIVDTVFSQSYVQVAGRDDLINGLENMYEKTGKIISSKLSTDYKTAIDGISGSREVTVEAEVEFEKIQGFEIFVFQVREEVNLLLHQIHDKNSNLKLRHK